MKLITLLLSLTVSTALSLKAQVSCLCPASPTNITIIWSKTFDIGANDVISDIEPISTDGGTPDDGFVVVGSANMGYPTGMDIHIKRLNTSGNIVWSETIDMDHNVDAAYAVEQTSNAQLIIAGSSKTDLYPSFLGDKNRNAWLTRMNLNGTTVSGWPKEFGSTGDDVAYELKEAESGNIVIAGQAGVSGDDVPSGTQGGAGDYWVFKTNASGTIISGRNKVYHGSNTTYEQDYARSVVVDCVTGEYIVTGFCKSCYPVDFDFSALYMLKIPVNFGTPTEEEVYGYEGERDDFGSYNVIQAHEVFETCSSTSGFLSLGLQHPDGSYGCFGGQHDFWTVLTDNNLAPNDFTLACENSDYGSAFGGKKKDNGHSAVQICDGFLLAGLTKSNNKDLSCTLCQVTCNHYECTPAPETEDIWIAKIDYGTGELAWNESIGGTGNDGAYSLKRLPDGTFVVAGYTTNPLDDSETDWYIVKFEITDCDERLSQEISGFNVISVYPNPSFGSFTLSLQTPEKITVDASVEILDLAGKPFYRNEVSIEDGLLQQQISGVTLSAGFHLVKIVVNGTVYLQPLIIQ